MTDGSPERRLDPRVLSVFSEALDNDGIAAQVVLIQCFTAAFGESEWWQRMLVDDPAVAALVHHTNRKVIH